MKGVRLLLVEACVTALAAPVPAAVKVERQIEAMGSRLELRIEAADRAAALAASELAISAVQAAEQRLSTWREDSELSRVNRSQPGAVVAVSPELGRDLDQAFSCARETGGAFDPAVGSLVDAWGLRGRGKVPSETDLKIALNESRSTAFDVGNSRVIRKHARARIEEGGFGKGAGLDDAARALRAAQVAQAELNFGGQVLLLGTREARIAIADPRRRDRILLTLSTGEGSVSTSGNSEHGLKVGKRRVGHILDPRTGKPAPFDGSVTVVAPTGAEADCLSTGLYVMGPKTGLAWLRSQGKGERLQAIFVSKQGKRWLAQASCGLRGKLQASDGRVKVVYDCGSAKPAGGDHL